MARNVEIKARVTDVDHLVERAKTICTSDSVLLEQEDIFYNALNGRLKLRSEKGLESSLIHYDRADVEGPKLCNYEKCSIHENDVPGLKIVLSKALGQKGIVRKKRRVFMVDQTRVHIDTVDGLGNFMELEVVLEDDQSVEEGQQIANSLMEKLGVKGEDLLTGAYFDLLSKK